MPYGEEYVLRSTEYGVQRVDFHPFKDICWFLPPDFLTRNHGRKDTKGEDRGRQGKTGDE